MTKITNLEIMAEILSFCSKARTKTHVMYRTNMSWQMLQKYLFQLQSLGLLEVHHSLNKYARARREMGRTDWITLT